MGAEETAAVATAVQIPPACSLGLHRGQCEHYAFSERFHKRSQVIECVSYPLTKHVPQSVNVEYEIREFGTNHTQLLMI